MFDDFILVGGFNPSEKYEFVNWDDDIPNIWENKKCSKPPTRFYQVFDSCLFGILFHLIHEWTTPNRFSR